MEPDLRKNQRDKDSFYDLTRKGIAAAKSAGKPFYLVMNINDPHKPFYGMDNRQNLIDDPLKPSRIFEADEVVVPGFLPDTPGVRLELAHYYSSVRRADDCAGAVLKALEDSGEAQNTLIMFLSDHGMALPFAKTAVWHHSTHTPWLVRWPGVVESERVDDEHMISAVDFAPTILDVLGIPEPKDMDGHSFLPVLKTGKQAGRDYIIKEYNENSGGNRSPMRAIQGRKYSYIFNPWSDGERVFKTATTGTIAYKEMQRLAAIDPEAAERLRLFDYRDPEELYDYENDPDALNNLIDNPEMTVKYREFGEMTLHRLFLTTFGSYTIEFNKSSSLSIILHNFKPLGVKNIILSPSSSILYPINERLWSSYMVLLKSSWLMVAA